MAPHFHYHSFLHLGGGFPYPTYWYVLFLFTIALPYFTRCSVFFVPITSLFLVLICVHHFFVHLYYSTLVCVLLCTPFFFPLCYFPIPNLRVFPFHNSLESLGLLCLNFSVSGSLCFLFLFSTTLLFYSPQAPVAHVGIKSILSLDDDFLLSI